MGVLACDRNGCNNIMCDRLSHKYGYLCWECYSELVAKKVPVEQIQIFMNTPKVQEEENPYTEEFYSKIFKLRDF